MIRHEIALKGYFATTGEEPKPMLLGTRGSYGLEQLHLMRDGIWNGLTVTATFHPPGSGAAVTVAADADDNIDVPPEATQTAARIAPGKIVFLGLGDGVQPISADVRYTVLDHADAGGEASAGVTPDVWSQYVQQAAGYAKTAAEEADRAENAAKQAENATPKIGAGLKLEDGVLTVDCAEDVEKDNTLPVTSAAVYTEIGNIEALLGTV